MKRLKIEIADTPSRRERGLMDRKSLGEDNGMLFKFPYKDFLRFWMKDTYIPLDIAFLDDEGEVLQIKEMYPRCTKAIQSDYPCRYALEVNHGWFDKNDVGVGDKVFNIKIASRGISRFAQMTPQVPTQLPDENITPAEEEPQLPEQENAEQQPNPRVELTLDDRAKVRYAEQHNLAMQIVYQSKESGQTLPPRKLLPSPVDGGYPIRVSEGGEYFVAYDSSPTINGGDWQILGNQIKRFLFSNIIALEVLNEFAG